MYNEFEMKKQERDRLLSALDDIVFKKRDEARKDHHLEHDKVRTPRELVEAFATGHWKYSEEGEIHKDDREYWFSPMDGIEFGDPEMKPDYESFSKVCKKIDHDADAIRLKIRVLEPKDSLKEVERFREKEYE